MKIFYFQVLTFIIYISYSFSHKCVHERYMKPLKKLDDSNIIENSTRKLDNGAQPISFFVDYTLFDKDTSVDSSYKTFLKSAINSTLNIFKELIKVKYKVKFLISNPKECYPLITDYDKKITQVVEDDIILVPLIDPTLEKGIEAAAFSCFILGPVNRPVMGVVLLNQNYSYNKVNAEEYLVKLLLHEITHILVFSPSLFDLYLYPGEVTKNKTINGVLRTLIITDTVRNAAAQHFGCNSIIGLELENQGDIGSVGCHWEARTMLGDYMISTVYDDIAISDITLALFVDSGWYEVNYYTGGLFKFGKGQGCSFLNNVCVTSKEVNFEYDFCDEKYTCSPDNLNRGYCFLVQYYEPLPSIYQYYNNSYIGGWEPADFCPVTLFNKSNEYYFSGSCVNGEKSSTELSYPESLGFSISNTSICILSSLVNSSDPSLSSYKYPRTMCHKITCDQENKIVIVDIGYINIYCPTSGGYFKVNGFDGFIKCPPYNRVCTSSRFVSNIFDAVYNHLTNIDMDYTFPSYYLSNDSESIEEELNSSENENEKEENGEEENYEEENDNDSKNLDSCSNSSNEQSVYSSSSSVESEESSSSNSNINEKSISSSSSNNENNSFSSSKSKNDRIHDSSSSSSKFSNSNSFNDENSFSSSSYESSSSFSSSSCESSSSFNIDFENGKSSSSNNSNYFDSNSLIFESDSNIIIDDSSSEKVTDSNSSSNSSSEKITDSNSNSSNSKENESSNNVEDSISKSESKEKKSESMSNIKSNFSSSSSSINKNPNKSKESSENYNDPIFIISESNEEDFHSSYSSEESIKKLFINLLILIIDIFIII